MFDFLQDSAVKLKLKYELNLRFLKPKQMFDSDPKNEQPANEKLNSRFTLIDPISQSTSDNDENSHFLGRGFGTARLQGG